MSDDEPVSVSARVVPCDVEGDRMYAGGRVWVRGRPIDTSGYDVIYEWLPLKGSES